MDEPTRSIPDAAWIDSARGQMIEGLVEWYAEQRAEELRRKLLPLARELFPDDVIRKMLGSGGGAGWQP
jgi:hypothetical protein